MRNNQRLHANMLFILLGLAACGGSDSSENSTRPITVYDGQPTDNPVAADILLLVLGKMSLYDQSPDGDISQRPFNRLHISPVLTANVIQGV
jgi:hypothetical protein